MGIEIKKLSDDEFYSFFDSKVQEMFQDTFSYSIHSVRTEKEIAHGERLKGNLQSGDRLHLALYEDGKLAGWSTSSQFRQYSLYTHNSAVLPEFRRKGFYTMLVRATIEEATKLGYQVIFSNHVVSNNDVIIAKLKLGFKVSGIEVFDDYGTTVKLSYYINETRNRAYDVRTGLKRPDQGLREIFKL